jgi:hypothetical protein
MYAKGLARNLALGPSGWEQLLQQGAIINMRMSLHKVHLFFSDFNET